MHSKAWFSLAIAVAVFSVTQARADITNYTIVSSLSSLNLDVKGTVLGGAATATEQNASAITRYSGNIKAEFPGGAGVGSNITFPGNSSANANNTLGLFNIAHQYQPNVNGASGSAPANYGVNISAPLGFEIPPFEYEGVTINLGTLQSFDLKMAIRNLVLDVHGGPIDIQPGFLFDASETSLSIAGGYADISGLLTFKQPDLVSYFAAALLFGSLPGLYPELGLTVTSSIFQLTNSIGFGSRIDLATLGNPLMPNTTALNGSVTGTLYGDPSTLILPVTAQLPDLGLAGIVDLELTLTGQLRATGTIVPEPSTFALAGIGLVGVAALAIRKRRRNA